VIVAQAPLFSTNPKIGDFFAIFNAFHTAIVLAQNTSEGRRFWTLEFDFTGGSILTSIVPRINESSLTWNNDARFCLSEGILWNRTHWNKTFMTVAHLTADQATRTFRDLVYPLNRSSHGEGPQYQLWRVSEMSLLGKLGRTFIEDTTCSNGVVWFLHFIEASLGIKLRADFVFHGTAVGVNAQGVSAVNASDTDEWEDVVVYYQGLLRILSTHSKLEELLEVLFEWKPTYVYDSNSRTYYKVIGNHQPWFEAVYVAFPLVAPPYFATPSSGAGASSLHRGIGLARRSAITVPGRSQGARVASVVIV
jgi:hypothetical protein